MFICIAGKNKCSIDALRVLTQNRINKRNILVLPNTSDDGYDGWQPSLKKFSHKNKLNFKKIKK